MAKRLLHPFLFLAAFSFWVNISTAQSFLNGSFETTTSPASCNYNISNATYNSLMSNSTAFGAYQALDIVVAGCYVPSIANGIRAVNIANNPPNNSQGEAISLALSAPLIAGNTYTISFEAYAITTFGPRGDLLIGASTSNTSFGTAIFTANTVVNVWTNFTFSFTAPNNATHITVMPVPGISSWNSVDNFSMIAVLPIASLNFEASLLENKEVKLDWQTASEINNAYFTIERSQDAVNWEVLDKVDAVGNAVSESTYSITDKNPYTGISYYRLKQTSLDGQFAWSEVISVEIEASQSSPIEVYPNPTFSHITLKGTDFSVSKVKIYNMSGQDVSALTSVVERSKKTLVLDISKLEKGTYCIKTEMNSIKVSKQ